MKLGIIGSRTFDNYIVLEEFIKNTLQVDKIELIVSGDAQGADKMGAFFAERNNIKTLIFPPDWDKHGKAAGFIRNKDIVNNSDIILAFWDGKSKGTRHSIGLAHKMKKTVIIYYF